MMPGLPTPEDGDEITGPSSGPVQNPYFVTGTVAAPVIRTGLQGGAGVFVVQGIEAFNIYAFTDAQRSWSIVAITIAFAFIQNQTEKVKGRRFIGAAS